MEWFLSFYYILEFYCSTSYIVLLEVVTSVIFHFNSKKIVLCQKVGSNVKSVGSLSFVLFCL